MGGGEPFQHLPAFGLQMIGVEGKEHIAADPDLAVVEGDAPGGQRAGQGFFQGLAALFFLLAFGDFGFQAADQLQLHAKDTHQNEDEGPEQAGHQVAKDRPDGRAVFAAGVVLFHAHASLTVPATRCRSSTIFFCERMERSMISRA